MLLYAFGYHLPLIGYQYPIFVTVTLLEDVAGGDQYEPD